MKKYSVDKIRNIALVSHGGAGKTSLAEAMLYDSGGIDRLGRVDDGTATMDYDPEETKRGISINASFAPCEWRDHKINIIDTPGYFDFVGEVKASLRVVDGAVIVVEAAAGVEVGTELVWRYAEDYGLPRLIVINKMDRENANFDATLEQIRSSFGLSAAAVQIPIGSESSFKGVVDLLKNKAYVYDGKDYKETEVPGDLAAKVEELREPLVEAIAENDDELLMKYLDGEELSEEELINGLQSATKSGKMVPVLCASGGKNIGVQNLMDAIVNWLPSPADAGEIKAQGPDGSEVVLKPSEDEEFGALVFKTMADPYVGKLTVFRVFSGKLKSDSSVFNANRGKSERVGQIFIPKGKSQESITEASVGDIAAVAKLQETTTGDTLTGGKTFTFPPIEFPRPVYSVAVMPKSKGDEEKIGSGLARLSEEDPTFHMEKNTETGQLVVSGMGEMHLEVLTDRLKRKFGVEVTTEPPRIPYRETIRGNVKVEGKHKKQSGGRGQYGHVWLEIEPTTDGKEFEWVDKIFGGVVPQQYRPAVEKGVREAMAEGVLAGYPVTGVKVTLYDGSYHPVDSSEMAFKIAGSLAFKKGALDAKPVLLEPIVTVEVMVPDQYMGDVIGDLNKKRGRILGMEPQGKMQVVKAMVPLAEMSRYAIDLRSITQGRGTYTMEITDYEEVPANVAETIIEEAKKAKSGEQAG